MPKKIGNSMRTGRRNVTPQHLISPLGYDATEKNDYSPAKHVEGSKTGKAGSPSRTESATGQRRGD